jgi:hypothetical protein
MNDNLGMIREKAVVPILIRISEFSSGLLVY